MLSVFDDYPIHQTPAPIREPATSDRNAYDRYWFNGMSGDGDVYFAIALGRYPNRFVLDGGLTVATGGEQRSCFVSRLAPPDPADLTIGPFRLDVLRPMRELRLTVVPNESGLSCDLRWSSRSSAIEEDRMTVRREGMTAIDLTRFTQFGRWSGWIEIDGRRIDLHEASTFGTRDRSWGVRPLGEPARGRPGTATNVFWNWLPLQFDDCAVHAWRYDASDGATAQSQALIAPTYPTADASPVNVEDARHFRRWSHDFTFVPGTRAISGGSITLHGRDEDIRIEIVERLATAYPLGLGYSHDEWGHGVWKGDLAVGRDGWLLADVDLQDVRFMLMHHVCRLRMGERIGIGVVEQSYTGPYEPYGFVGTTGVLPTSTSSGR
jgi:hypothetical protein